MTPLVDEVVEVEPVPAVVAAVVVAVLVVVVEAIPSTHLQMAGFELHGQY